jgi:hypothetical protein
MPVLCRDRHPNEWHLHVNAESRGLLRGVGLAMGFAYGVLP